MLHLIFGRAGSGKTKFARNFFKENYNSAKKQILIVPEQYSFETEKAVLEIMGEEKASKINVMSFSRLSEWFFRLYGGLAGQKLTDAGKAVLMQLAIDNAIDNIEVYRKSAQKGELIDLLLSVDSEMKMCAVSPEELFSFAEKTNDEELMAKTKEISLVLSLYDSLVARSYIDPLDELTKMDKMLSQYDFFKDSVIVIDSFSGFTMQEMNIISHMLIKADDVYITFCCDNISNENDIGLFSNTAKTLSKVMRKARENGVKIAKPVHLDSSLRFENEELKELEKYLFSWEYEQFEKEPENIEVYKAASLYDESEYVCAKIRELTMKENYRYRDIAVISRNPNNYLGILDVALDERNIAYFMDKPEEVLRKPLVRAVMSALEIVSGGYQSADIFSYLKTGMLKISSYEISLLENYTYLWKISGKKWLSEFKENPNGFGSSMREEDRKTLEIINEQRRKAIEPLRKFEKAANGANGQEISLAIYNLLEDIGAKDQISLICEKFDAQGETSKSQEQIRIWDIVMEVLDQISSIMGEKKLDLKEALRLFKTIFSAISISDIPKGVDEVTIGAADRVRLDDPKAVFIMGAVRGEFPKVPQNDSLFSLDERKLLIDAGMPIGRSFEESSSEEMLIAYLASCSSSCKVFFSYSAEGGAYPSEMILRTQNIFPKLSVKTKDTYKEEYFADTIGGAFRLASKKWAENSPKANALKEYFEEKEAFEGKIEALKNIVSEKNIEISDKNIAMSLFGSGHRLSASQIETYHLCRFRYFCQYALKARKIEPVDLSALEYGSLMHYLFEKIFFSYDSKELVNMSEKELRNKIEVLTKEYSKENYEGYDEKSKRFSVMIKRLCDTAYFLISHIALELSQSKFKPESFEKEVGTDELPMNISMEDGRTVSVVGKIDRVDVFEDENGKYVRVVDYKTGRKEFDFSEVLYGLNLQMLLYLAALVENKKGEPAGVLYMPSKTSSVSKERDASEDELLEEFEKTLKMNGIVLNDEGVVSAMEEKAQGRFIPVKKGKNGELSASEYLVSREEFDILSDSIKKKIVSMTKTLQNGDIDASPLMVNKFGCSYCPYFAVCKREYKESDVEKSKLKHNDVMNILKGGDEDEREEMDSFAGRCD